MFPIDDINSFTIQYSDQFLLYSTLLDDAADIDLDLYNHNPFSPFSFYDNQNMAAADQQLELQTSRPLLQHHVHEEEEEEEPMLTAFEEFTMADTRRTNTRSTTTSFGAYCTTENLQQNGSASDPTNGISTSAVVGGMKNIDYKVSRNVNLSKKDRHSKINTAQGPRDRRMRLSLDIAKRFFGLQDMLGFDKASKTVDWLLSKSQSEINKVAGIKAHDVATTKSSESFGASDCCEEVSEVVNKDELFRVQSGEINDTNLVNNKKSSANKAKKKSTGKVSAASLRNGFNNLAKESREKARARARERTKEKMLLCTNSQNHNNKQYYENANNNHISNMDQNMWNQQVLGRPHAYPSVDQVHHHMATNQDEYLENTFHWNPSTSCTLNNNLQQHISETSHQLPFEDHQLYAKPWETYN